MDIDLYDRVGNLEDAEAALRAATARDVGDHFRFVLAPGRRIAEAGVALRVNATAFLGVSEFARFNADVVAGTGMTGTDDPEWRTGYARVALGVPRLVETDLDAAVATAGRLLDPVLQGTARGRWMPDQLAWIDS